MPYVAIGSSRSGEDTAYHFFDGEVAARTPPRSPRRSQPRFTPSPTSCHSSTMSREHSLRQSAQSVQHVLTGYKGSRAAGAAALPHRRAHEAVMTTDFLPKLGRHEAHLTRQIEKTLAELRKMMSDRAEADRRHAKTMEAACRRLDTAHSAGPGTAPARRCGLCPAFRHLSAQDSCLKLHVSSFMPHRDWCSDDTETRRTFLRQGWTSEPLDHPVIRPVSFGCASVARLGVMDLHAAGLPFERPLIPRDLRVTRIPRVSPQICNLAE